MVDFRARTNPLTERRIRRTSPNASRFESARASFDLAAESTLGTLLFSEFSTPDEDPNALVEPSVLNRKFPQLETPFAESTSLEVARHIADRDQRRKLQQKIIAEGPDDAFQTAINFGAAMGASAVDPVEMAANVAGGWAFRGAFKGFKFMQRAGKLANAQRSLTSQFVAAASIEPVIAGLAQRQQERFTTSDVFASVVGSTLMGSTLELGGLAAKNFISDRLSGKLEEKFPAAVAQQLSNKSVNVDDFSGTPRLDRDLFTELGERVDTSTPAFTPIPEGNANRQFFAADIGGKEFASKRTLSLDGIFESGITLTDNPKVALRRLGTKANQNGKTSLSVIRPKQTLNLLDANKPFSEAKPLVQKAIDLVVSEESTVVGAARRGGAEAPTVRDAADTPAVRGGLPGDPDVPPVRRGGQESTALAGRTKDLTLKEALETRPLKERPFAEQAIRDLLERSEEGVDGLFYSAGDSDLPHNIAFLTKRDKLEELASAPVDKSKFKPDPEQLRNFRKGLSEEEGNIFFQPEIKDLRNKLSERPVLDETKDSVFTEQQLGGEGGGRVSEFDSLAEREDLSPEARETVNESRDLEANLEQADSILEQAVNCRS